MYYSTYNLGHTSYIDTGMVVSAVLRCQVLTDTERDQAALTEHHDGTCSNQGAHAGPYGRIKHSWLCNLELHVAPLGDLLDHRCSSAEWRPPGIAQTWHPLFLTTRITFSYRYAAVRLLGPPLSSSLYWISPRLNTRCPLLRSKIQLIG